MRMATLALALAVLASVAACNGERRVVAESRSVPPLAVNCGDAAQLRQHAADDRRRVDESRSDHERISIGSRANLLASLAVVADLKCKVSSPEVDDLLKPALEAAQEAEANASVYEKTRGFAGADFTAHRVIELLVQRIAK